MAISKPWIEVDMIWVGGQNVWKVRGDASDSKILRSEADEMDVWVSKETVSVVVGVRLKR